MANNTDNWQTVMGEGFKVKRPEKGADDKTWFTVKSFKTGKFLSCTLWDNSHGHLTDQLNDGMVVIVNGKIKAVPSTTGGDPFLNMNVSRIAIIAMDAGVDDRESTNDGGSSDDEPDLI